MDAKEFNLRLRQCETPADCTQLFRGAIADFGMHTFAVGELDLAVRERTLIYIQDWPDPWRNFYLGAQFVHRDPVVDGLTDRWEPFTWSDLRADRCFDLGGRGLNRIGVVSMAGRTDQLDRSAIDHLTLIGTCLHSHVRTLLGRHGVADSMAGLSPREMDCLRLVALGLTDAEIGRELAIAVSTAHEHVENATRKLCTKSRAEAAAVAASLGIVDM
jgi:DNA-binding CsgD family transcriptional regulator